MYLKISTFLVFLSFCSTLQAGDLLRERRIAEQIVEAIFDGDSVYLDANGQQFLAIYTRSTLAPGKGAAIIVHGKAANPDWVDVINPLRVGLTEHGWDTLSIQMPVASEGADDREWDLTVPEAGPRLEAALAFLKERGFLNVAVVAHSLGARMAAEYLARNPSGQVRALVTVGMSADPSDRQAGTLGALRELKIPILDIYGENDLASVKETTKERQLAARDAKNKHYRQIEIAGADHFFANHSERLNAKVRAWLARMATGSEVPRAE